MSRDLISKIKPRIKLVSWVVFSIILGIFLASLVWLVFKNINYEKIFQPKNNLSAQINGAAIAQSPTREEIRAKEKPKYFYLNKDSNGQPKVSALAYLIGDLNTGEVILSKNQDQKFPIASVSKLMTALVTKEITNSNDSTQVSKKALNTEGKNGGLKIGEKIKIMDLIYPLLLESSNDAAEIIAEHFGRDTFIKKMNQEAEKLKMSSTSYEDPSGLSEKNQSTVSDIFKLTGYLNQQKQDLLQITTKRSFSNKKHSWSNISQFLHKNIYYGGEADANTNWVQEKVGAPDIKDPDFVSFAFVGDTMLDRGVKNSVIKNFNNDYSALFEKLEILKEYDIVFANLEGTASDKGIDQKNLYSFHMDPAVIPALKGAGISILSVANNHIGDWGRVAYIDTLSRLKENEILYTGGGNNSIEAEQPTIIEKYGMKIGFLGFSDKGPNPMEAGTEKAGLLLANNPRFDEIIKNASKQVDYLVVSFHFGEEYQAKHNARQEYLAHKAIDDGAKIIIGSHPHVIEDTEIYKNSYIAYSLGNFIFDQKFSQNTMQGMLLQIKLNRDGSMTVKKNIVKLNSAFQPDKIVKGKEEKIPARPDDSGHSGGKFQKEKASLKTAP